MQTGLAGNADIDTNAYKYIAEKNYTAMHSLATVRATQPSSTILELNKTYGCKLKHTLAPYSAAYQEGNTMLYLSHKKIAPTFPEI